jgi:polar amino acid transport system substrate-binding protein
MMHFGKSMFAGLFAAILAVSAQAQPVVKITNGDWPPYLGERLKYNGLASRIITEAFKQEGIQVNYGFFPWSRSLMLAKEGSWDGAAVWLKNPEREQDFYLSDPVVESKYVFFHLKGKSFDWKTVDDLRGLKIGGTASYDYGKAFQDAEAQKTIYVERTTSDELNLRKLIAGRIDIFPVDIEVGYGLAKAALTPEEVAQLTSHPTPLRVDPLYLLLSRKSDKNAELVKVFNRGLATLKSSGKVDQFIAEAREGG